MIHPAALVIILVMCSACACHLDGWGSLEAIPHSYYNVSTQNILRCGRLCERQGNCAAVTFDQRQRRCYMHDVINANVLFVAGTGTNGRYLLKKYLHNPQNHKTGSTCDKETQIVVPSARYENGTCYKIKEPCTSGGYRYYRTENICLKVYTTPEVQIKQKAKCEADGAHLLLIRDAAMHKFIKLMLIALGSGDVFVDGEDPELDGEFATSSGDPLPYINWKSGDPDIEPCMRLTASADFDFGDESCSATRYEYGCVCEKDIP